MSDAHEHEEHQAFIKTPKQLIIVVLAAFIVPISIIVLLVTYVGSNPKVGAGSDNSVDAVNKRIAPVAQLDIRDPSAPRVFKTGEQVFKAVCAACHESGAAGAPKFGDKAAWSARIGKGYDALLKSLLNGKNAMSARAGTSPDDYSDYELGRAVVYMANAGGAKFNEPAAPAAPAPAAPAADAAPAAMPAAMPAAAPAPAAQPAAAAAAPAKVSAETGKKVYSQVCQACHAAGVAGAPKFGDKAAWAPRIKTGMPALYNSALHGKNAMPPKGGYAGSDDDVKAAVDYMVSAAK